MKYGSSEKYGTSNYGLERNESEVIVSNGLGFTLDGLRL
jgi:hypothetical protein